MMTKRAVIGLLVKLVLASWVSGQDLTLPAEIKGGAARFIPVTATTAGKSVAWIAADDRLDVFPLPLADPKSTVVIGPKGTFKLWAVTCVGEKMVKASTLIVIEGGGPDPGPGPGPGPGPQPDTPLIRELKAAYAKEGTADKQVVDDFAAACAKAADAAKNESTKLIKEVNDVFVAQMKANVGNLCPHLRAVVNAELNAKLPRSPTATLDAPTRALIADVFNEIAAGLKGLQ